MMAMEGQLYQYMLCGRWLIKSSGRIMFRNDGLMAEHQYGQSHCWSKSIDVILLDINLGVDSSEKGQMYILFLSKTSQRLLMSVGMVG